MPFPKTVRLVFALLFVACVERFEVDGGVLGTTTTATAQSSTTDSADASTTGDTAEDEEEDSSTGDCDRCSKVEPDLHHNFDEHDHYYDVSGNGYHTYPLFVPRYVEGFDGSAVVFDEEHPYFTVISSFTEVFGPALLGDGVTVSMRWRPGHYPWYWHEMLGLRDPGPPGTTEATFALASTDSHVRVFTTVSATLTTNPPVGEWVTQTFVLRKDEVRYYEWGELQATGLIDLSASFGSWLVVGGFEESHIHGHVDDLKIWLKPLTDNEVLESL